MVFIRIKVRRMKNDPCKEERGEDRGDQACLAHLPTLGAQQVGTLFHLPPRIAILTPHGCPGCSRHHRHREQFLHTVQFASPLHGWYFCAPARYASRPMSSTAPMAIAIQWPVFIPHHLANNPASGTIRTGEHAMTQTLEAPEASESITTRDSIYAAIRASIARIDQLTKHADLNADKVGCAVESLRALASAHRYATDAQT